MDFPEKLKTQLASVDEEYLIGLSNKGTLNRGKKDLASLENVTASPGNEEITIQWGDVQCMIREPLGSSTCSCPSSSFCRHRITAILWLKSRIETAPQPAKTPVFRELREYPADKLMRILGPRRVSAIAFRQEAGVLPHIEQGSVVFVELPWVGASVRLLEPLEHSTCSCHSSSFCVHKAEALLCWQLQQGITRPAQFQAKSDGQRIDPEQIRGICRAVREVLSSLMASGLSRTSPEICPTLERMASLCHTALLADLERSLRRLWGEYSACFARSAGFRDTVLLERLSHSFRLAGALENASDEELPALAGIFRDEYRQVGDLKLYLLGSRTYAEKNGYAGTIYYFWNRKTEDFCSFRHIRPTFYEGKAQHIPRHAAPWGLPCTLDKIRNNSLDLTGAKMNSSGSLSSTTECTATLIGKAPPGSVIPDRHLCRDFRELLDRSAPTHSENRRLALICPTKLVEQPYDTIRQVYSLRLVDALGQDLWVTVPYTPENARMIDALERLTRGLAGASSHAPIFFGTVYREDDRLKCYPIEYFLNWEVRG